MVFPWFSLFLYGHVPFPNGQRLNSANGLQKLGWHEVVDGPFVETLRSGPGEKDGLRMVHVRVNLLVNLLVNVNGECPGESSGEC